MADPAASDPSGPSYTAQDRGAAGAYDRYLAGMDASMRQKVALTAAFLLCEGDVADMGMGSGTGSQALAALYPSLRVVGVDVNPEMVARASQRYRLPNLRFIVGDIAEPVFAPGELEAVLDSSVLHHVTTFNGYDRDAAARALRVQVGQLAEGGVLVVRDFLDPGEATVWLDVPCDDGLDSPDAAPTEASTAALLERFASEFRYLRPPHDRGFDLTPCLERPPGCRPGWRRYQLSARHAVEFVLRKDYRADWATEVLEEYTYLTQAGFERVFAQLGLRVLASTPIRNPWIVANRFVEHFELRDADGARLDWPATNYIAVGQKVPRGAGVRFTVAGPCEPIGYLEPSCWRHVDSGAVYDLIRRPGRTIDVIPWFQTDSAIRLLARMSYPRPVAAVSDAIDGHPASEPLGGEAAVSYVTEPLIAIQTDKPLAQTVEELLDRFEQLGPDAIRRFEAGDTYYPSPGGLQEEVAATFVEVDAFSFERESLPFAPWSGHAALRAIEVRQLLRAAQVGALPDARLELNAYELLLRRRADPGAWIGAALTVPAGGPWPCGVLQTLLERPRRRAFRRAARSESTGFIALRAAIFEELDAAGDVLASAPLEYVVPATRSARTVAVALLRRSGDTVLIGLADDDRPAAQCFQGHSDLWVTPAWRLPREVRGMDRAKAWTRAAVAQAHGVRCERLVPLGGRYQPSAAMTPEVVHPFAATVTDDAPADAEQPLLWVSLAELVEHREHLRDGHLRVVALRAAHALGLLAQ